MEFSDLPLYNESSIVGTEISSIPPKTAMGL